VSRTKRYCGEPGLVARALVISTTETQVVWSEPAALPAPRLAEPDALPVEPDMLPVVPDALPVEPGFVLPAPDVEPDPVPDIEPPVPDALPDPVLPDVPEVDPEPMLPDPLVLPLPVPVVVPLPGIELESRQINVTRSPALVAPRREIALPSTGSVTEVPDAVPDEPVPDAAAVSRTVIVLPEASMETTSATTCWPLVVLRLWVLEEPLVELPVELPVLPGR
jgi:hypothetical protein